MARLLSPVTLAVVIDLYGNLCVCTTDAGGPSGMEDARSVSRRRDLSCPCSIDRSHWGVVKCIATTRLSSRVSHRPSKLSQILEMGELHRKLAVLPRRMSGHGRALCLRLHCLHWPPTATGVLKALL